MKTVLQLRSERQTRPHGAHSTVPKVFDSLHDILVKARTARAERLRLVHFEPLQAAVTAGKSAFSSHQAKVRQAVAEVRQGAPEGTARPEIGDVEHIIKDRDCLRLQHLDALRTAYHEMLIAVGLMPFDGGEVSDMQNVDSLISDCLNRLKTDTKALQDMVKEVASVPLCRCTPVFTCPRTQACRPIPQQDTVFPGSVGARPLVHCQMPTAVESGDHRGGQRVFGGLVFLGRGGLAFSRGAVLRVGLTLPSARTTGSLVEQVRTWPSWSARRSEKRSDTGSPSHPRPRTGTASAFPTPPPHTGGDGVGGWGELGSRHTEGWSSDVLEPLYTVGGGGVPPPPRTPSPPPLPMFEADSQHFASAPRGFLLKNFWPAFGGDHRETPGGGGSQPTPPPFSDPPSLPF